MKIDDNVDFDNNFIQNAVVDFAMNGYKGDRQQLHINLYQEWHATAHTSLSVASEGKDIKGFAFIHQNEGQDFIFMGKHLLLDSTYNLMIEHLKNRLTRTCRECKVYVPFDHLDECKRLNKLGFRATESDVFENYYDFYYIKEPSIQTEGIHS